VVSGNVELLAFERRALDPHQVLAQRLDAIRRLLVAEPLDGITAAGDDQRQDLLLLVVFGASVVDREVHARCGWRVLRRYDSGRRDQRGGEDKDLLVQVRLPGANAI
jgi:hypothetical protein